MKRRLFLSGAGLAAGAALASSLPKPAIAQDKIEWKMVTSWPRGLPGLATGAERLADRIGKLSGGRLTIKVFAGGELVPALGCFDAVKQGTADMAHDAAYYHIDKEPAAGFFTAVPFGMTADELNGWVYFGGGQELWDELFAKHGIKAFLAGNTGVQMGGWFRKEIKSVKDLQGLKFRMPGQGGDALAKLGVTVVQLSGQDIFSNLQSGTIDGAEWIGPYNDLSLGFYKITKMYYWPGFHEPGSALQCMVNKQKFDALPEDLKQIIAAACAAENDIMLAEFNGRSPAALATLVNEHKVQLMQFPKDVVTAFGNASGQVMQDVLDKGDDLTKRIAKSYFKFLKDAKAYTKVTEAAYTAARALKFRYPEG
jgi:TRAP-type mannitol/chloroaromatic compound transport system substrate-binding protein